MPRESECLIFITRHEVPVNEQYTPRLERVRPLRPQQLGRGLAKVVLQDGGTQIVHSKPSLRVARRQFAEIMSGGRDIPARVWGVNRSSRLSGRYRQQCRTGRWPMASRERAQSESVQGTRVAPDERAGLPRCFAWRCHLGPADVATSCKK